MRSIKSRLLLLVALVFVGNVFAQEEEKEEKRFQLYEVHEDQVKPSKVAQYEKAAKMYADKLREHNISEGAYLATNTDNFRYLYVNPIESLKDVGQNPGIGELIEKMGEDAFGEMMDGFDGTYDRHGNYVIVLDNELTYMPDGITQTPEGENHRKFFYIYFTPENGSALRDAMKGVKALFESKKSTNYYRVYRSGYGNMDSYYMVAVSAKDPVDMEQKGAANDKLLGEDAGPVFSKVMGLAEKFEEYSGAIRPDLGYTPKND